ncbi:MAG: hypothetical protein AAFQ66_18210 [Pseudomonadota bacterium]
MTMTANAPAGTIRFPRDILTIVTTVLMAGAFSTIAFDFFGKSLSPMLGFGGLAPVPLANGVIKTIFGAGYTPGAHALHYFAGMIAYPAGWVLIAEPLRRHFAPQVHWFIAATVYGVALWVWALYFMAHLVAGNAPFLGWATITWVALVGHVLFAWVTATVATLRSNG